MLTDVDEGWLLCSNLYRHRLHELNTQVYSKPLLATRDGGYHVSFVVD